jgi:CheY-like chemotaxis protein
VTIKKVLLVDDDPGLRVIGQMSLECDFEVIIAADGKSALEQLAAEAPDLVLLDMMMPGMDGLETLARMKEKSPDVKVIFLTAKVQSHEMESYKDKGVLGVISKPFDPLTLVDEIRSVLGVSNDSP